MTLANAERITGYSIVRLDLDGFYFQAQDRGEHVASAGAKTEKEALRRLVEKVYKIHCEIVMRRQQFRCAVCGLIKPLSVHHRVFRSHGRDDRTSNLLALCNEDHEAQHRSKEKINGGVDPSSAVFE